MLVLTRKVGETLYAGPIKLKVVEVRGNKVRLAIDAPPDVRVHRGEWIERQRPQFADASCDVETAEIEYVDALPNGKSAVEAPAA